MSARPQIGWMTGALLVIANMIGVGVFLTSGYLLSDLHNGPAVLVSWLVGGLAALCGALCYAELGAALPQNGGEYRFLSRIYHPFIGFLAAFATLVVGFAAPMAFASAAFGKFLVPLLPEAARQMLSRVAGPMHIGPDVLCGVVLILLLSLSQSGRVVWGHGIQNATSILKVLLIGVFILAGLACCTPGYLVSESTTPLTQAVFSTSFASGLVYVAYAYSGWNAAAYISGEFRQPERNIPIALLVGTGLVTLVYLGLNFVFLASAPHSQLAGREDIGAVAAAALFGPRMGAIIACLIVAGLISAVGSLVVVGSRVYEAVGYEYPVLGWLTVRSPGGAPIVSIWLQGVLAIILLRTAAFDTLFKYIGVTLSFFAGLTVLGVIVLRYREPTLVRPYRTWGYPVTPLVFLTLEVWMIASVVIKAGAERDAAPLVGCAITLIVGTAAYFALLLFGGRTRANGPDSNPV